MENRILSVTANTLVKDYGQYVESFELTFEPGSDLSGVTGECFAFSKTAKHPLAGHESLGVWKTGKEGDTVTVSVDPFLFTDTYEGEAVIGGEKISLSRADVTQTRVTVVDDFGTFETESGMVYRLLIPESDGPLPLVVAFHGNGERGTDGLRHMVNNRVITKWGEPVSQARYKCIVLGPQSNDSWSDAELAEVRTIIDRLIEEKKADPHRIYAAGLAAFQATLRFSAANADLLAGVLAMLFWKQYTPDLSLLADLPIWMAIGVNDSTGESPFAREAYQYLTEQLHNDKARITVFPEDQMMSYGLYGSMTHWGWIPALDDPEICDWLFGNIRQD
jgi:predicted peptidase